MGCKIQGNQGEDFGNNSSKIILTGKLTDINNALATLAYTPHTKWVGNDSLTVTFNDNGNNSAGGNFAVSKIVNLN